MGDGYYIYLRKSRQDRDLEASTGKHDTLERHRAALLELAAKRGLTVTGIYEEVVSGDTIAERPEMQRLLADVETNKCAGVLVMEVARLARGNTTDQGIVAEAFQYSGTKIITPLRDYNPHEEADEEYFEFELFMSRREYKMINRRQQRGRMASLQEGKYIAGTAPYGYEKYKLHGQKGYSLSIVPEEADVVRGIFREFTATQKGSYTIANERNLEGVEAPGGGSWSASSVRDIVKNPVYAGYLRWSYRPLVKRMEGGVRFSSMPVNKNPTIVKGLHEPIVSEEIYHAAQDILERRGHAPMPGNKTATNPVAGLVICSVCGRSMVQLPHGSKKGPMLMCPTPGCSTVSSRTDVVEAAILDGLRLWLAKYVVADDAHDNVSDVEELRQDVERKKAAIVKLEAQRGRLYDFLEQGVYTQEIFLERSRTLLERTTEAKTALDTAEAQAVQAEKYVELHESIGPKIQSVLKQYPTLSTPAEKSALLKTVLDRVVYSKSKGGRYIESDMRVHVFPSLPHEDGV